MELRRGIAVALVAAGLVALSCSADRGSVTAEADASRSKTASSAELVESSGAATRIAELRARFRFPAVGLPMATGFEPVVEAEGPTHLRAKVPSEALGGVRRAANVALPMRANGEVKLEELKSRVAVRFALDRMQNTPVEVTAGMALYRGALDGADVVHRVHAEGTEDFVVFERRPAFEELSYSVDVSRVAGLRLLSDTLEFLDEGGSPALRIAPPYVVDTNGTRHGAKLAVRGCVVDANHGAPWGGAITRPGADRCIVRVTWGDVVYPAMVDPAWTSTGSMATARYAQAATLLPSGRVLVAGGDAVGTGLASAELYDPAAGAGAGAFIATGSMATARYEPTASLLASGKVLITGGANGGGTVGTAELFDPVANGGAGAFVATGPLTTPRRSHTASMLASGKVLVVGGLNGGAYVATAEVFNPAANGGAGAFAATGSMADARASHTATVLPSGKVLVAAGTVLGGFFEKAELFDPAGNGGVGAFAATGSLAFARWGHSASLLASGKVLVTGGKGVSGYLASAELFDPAANGGAGAFAPTGAMAVGRYYHTSSVLPSGRVLVAGGNNGLFLSSAELFDAAANGGIGAFADIGSMASLRDHHTATVLASGRVLVAGGYNGTVVAGAEVVGGVLAEACTTGYCLSGTCVDGFCCDTPCAGGCDRCNLPGAEGTCTVVPSGNAGANPACAFPLACDGVNATCPTSCASDAACAAAYYCAPNGTCQARKAQAAACNTQANCKVAGCRECASGNCVDGFCCDKPCGGTCEACAKALKQSATLDGTCGPIKDGTDPRDECTPMGAACGPDGMCNGAGACRLYAAAGVSCGAGICIGTIAKGDVCDGAGACGSAPAGFECAPFLCAGGGCTTTCVTSADCAASGYCNAAGKCEKLHANGKACTEKGQCSSNLCVDGVCCNAPCTGQCEACDVAGAEGTCAPVSGAPHGRTPCAPGNGGQPCTAAVCNGTERNTCAGFVGASIACGAASCTQGVARAVGKCDGKGTCQALDSPCGAYACGATACITSCTKDLDCATGNSCDVTTGKCAAGATCDGDHTTKLIDGTTQDCVPYRCDSTGSCRKECSSVADCVAPAVCDANHRCISIAAEPGDDGCTVGHAGVRVGKGGSVWLAWLSAVVVLLGRRRRLSGTARGDRR